MNNLKQTIFKRDGYKCQKCGFIGDIEDLEVNNILKPITLCSICHHFSPDSDEEFENYLNEKIDGTVLDTFRKSQKEISKRTKQGMKKSFEQGNIVVRPPLGYNIENKQLVLDTEKLNLVHEIFQEFVNKDISLTQLSKKHNLSVNGLKKVLTNYTYLGKIKFAGEMVQGPHKPLLSAELFNRVQEKLKEKGWA